MLLASATVQAQTSESLVVYLPFSEGSGAIAHDVSGYGNDGTIIGANWTTGQYGSALSFNGTGTYLETSATYSYDTSKESYTITAWIYQHSTQEYTFNSITGLGLASLGLIISTNNGNSVGAWANGNQGNGVNVGDLQNEWHHIAAVFTQSATWIPAKMYFDGEYVGESATDRTTPANGTATFAAAKTYYSYSTWFDGVVDEVQFYNRALSAEEIADLAGVTYTPETPDLVTVDVSNTWTYLFAGDFAGFFYSVVTTAFLSQTIGLAVISLIGFSALYLRTKSLMLMAILWLLLGSFLIALMPEAALLAIVFVVLGAGGLIYRLFRPGINS